MEIKPSRRGFLKLVGLFGAAATVCGVTPLLPAPIQVVAPLANGGLIKHTEDLIPVKLLDGECWVPELWAKESLRILEENMVIGNLVHRDFNVTMQYDAKAQGHRVKVDFEHRPWCAEMHENPAGFVLLDDRLKTVTLG